jgi:hypothetical protein
MNRLLLTDNQVRQLITAIDITENSTEDMTSEDLARLNIELDKTELFKVASALEAIIERIDTRERNI